MVKITRDAASGLILATIGGFAAVISSGYSLGTAKNMGPGLFPLIVSALLVLVGAALLLRSRITFEPPVSAMNWRPVAVVLASIVIFALTVDGLGIFLAVLLTILCASAASVRFRFSLLPLLGAILLATTCTLVFSVFFGLPMPVVGTWLQPLVPW